MTFGTHRGIPSNAHSPASLHPELNLAVGSGEYDVVARLASTGMDLNCACVRYQGDWLTTPLREACRRNDVRMVEVLLAAGADPHRSAQVPLTSINDRPHPLSWSHALDGFLATSNEAVVVLLEKHGWPRLPADRDRSLLLAAFHHWPNVVQRRLAEGANVHARLAHPVMLFPGAKSSMGNTPLHLAMCLSGDPDEHTVGQLVPTVQSLLNAGADPHALNDEQRTPMTLAFEAGGSGYNHPGANEQAQAMIALVQAGADVNRMEDQGSVLMRALADQRYDPLVPVLRAAGGTVQAPPLSEFMAMMDTLPLNAGSSLVEALRAGTLAQVNACLDLGADPNAEAQTLNSSPSRTTPIAALVRRTIREEVTPEKDRQEQSVLLERLLRAGLDLTAITHTSAWDVLRQEIQSPARRVRPLSKERFQRIAQMAEDLVLRRTLWADATVNDRTRDRPRL